MFRDRVDAGDRLAAVVAERGIDADVVLAIPRGGLPLGRAVADALEAPLDVVVAKKLGAPRNPEYAIAAVAADGSEWRNERAIDHLAIDEAYVERERERVAESAREKERRYRGDRKPLDLDGKRVVVVDDGVATGATVRACIESVKARGSVRVVVAVPVGSPDTVRELQDRADEVVCLQTPANFRAVGQFYRSFEQVSDEEAMAYLD
jgi:predicted phosphoribosyltransferase